MPDYNTFSDHAPSNVTGQISLGFVKTIPNNPVDPRADVVYYPDFYDQFVQKTSAQDSDVTLISDEVHALSDLHVTTGGTFEGHTFLNHRILDANSISVSDGQIATGATDLQNGIIYFTNRPNVEFTVSYFATPDAFFGDHLNALQNSMMVVQRLLGAGPITGEGLRGAEIWVDSLPPSLTNILPNAVNVRQIPHDIQISSAAGTTGNTITIGNSDDSVKLDVQNFTVSNSDASLSTTGQYGIDGDDEFTIYGGVKLAGTGSTIGGKLLGATVGPNVVLAVGDPTASIATGIPSSATGYPLPNEESTIARFYGDVNILGDVSVSGEFRVVNYGTGEQINIINDTLAIGADLRVTGNTILGSNTNTTTTINGTTIVGRSLHVRALGPDISRFDGPVDFANPGASANGLGGAYGGTLIDPTTKHRPDLPFHISNLNRPAPGLYSDLSRNRVSTVDGLDCSYIAKLLLYRSHDRHDYSFDCINDGPRSGYTAEVKRTVSPATSIFIVSGQMAWQDHTTSDRYNGSPGGPSAFIGGNAFRWFHIGGNYYHGKFENTVINVTGGEFSGYTHQGEGKEWVVLWTQDDTVEGINAGAYKYGSRVPLKKVTPYYDPLSPHCATGNQLELSRAFNTAVAVGDTLQVYHPVHSPGDILRQVDATTMRVYASTIEPIIGNIKGVHKVITTKCDKSVVDNYTGLNFVYMELDTPEIAKGQYQPGAVLQSPGQVVVTQELSPSDTRVLIGEFFSERGSAADGGNPGIHPDQIITYAYNMKHDSMWFRVNKTTNQWGTAHTDNEFTYYTGVTASGTSHDEYEKTPFYLSKGEIGDVLADDAQEYKTRIWHKFGCRKRAMDAKIRVFVAPNIGEDFASHDGSGVGPGAFREGPDYNLIQELEQAAARWEVVHVDRNFTDIVLYDLSDIPGAVIGARTSDDNNRDYTLDTAGAAASDYTLDGGISDRTGEWWWSRVVID
jgi:hypothetical protein